MAQERKSPAFVAGATGFTGREVVRILAGMGIRTVAHVRPDSPRLEEWRDRLGAMGAEVDSTPWDAASMTSTLQKLRPELVYALLGTTKARGRRAADEGKVETYDTVDFGLTAVLTGAAVKSGALPRFVYLSAAGVDGKARSPYYVARWKAESLIRSCGLPFTIARPSFITGAGRDDGRPLERLGAAVADGALSVAGAVGGAGLRDRYRSTTAVVLAGALVRLSMDPSAENRVVESEDLR